MICAVRNHVIALGATFRSACLSRKSGNSATPNDSPSTPHRLAQAFTDETIAQRLFKSQVRPVNLVNSENLASAVGLVTGESIRQDPNPEEHRRSHGLVSP